MKITLELFSRLREAAPDLDGTTIDLPQGARISDLLEAIYAAHPALKTWDKQMLVAVSLEWAARDRLLQDGETVSLMPPVQGG